MVAAPRAAPVRMPDTEVSHPLAGVGLPDASLAEDRPPRSAAARTQYLPSGLRSSDAGDVHADGWTRLRHRGRQGSAAVGSLAHGAVGP